MDYPLKIQIQKAENDTINTRALTSNRPIEIGSSTLLAKSCIGDAIKLWNLAPEEVKRCNSIYQIKKMTKKYVQSLPI